MSWRDNCDAGRGIPTETDADHLQYCLERNAEDQHHHHYHPQGEGERLHWIPAPGSNHGPDAGAGSSPNCGRTPAPYADCPSSADGQRQQPGFHHHYRLDNLGPARPCRRLTLRKRLQSTGYGVMLCTFLWMFLYTLSFSCCVGNSRLEAAAAAPLSSAQEEYGDENSVVGRVVVAGGGDVGGRSTRRLHYDYLHQRRVAPAADDDDDDDDDARRRRDDPNVVHALRVAVRRLDEDEDDTIYTLPEEPDPSPARSTQGGGGHDRYLFNRPDAAGYRHWRNAHRERVDADRERERGKDSSNSRKHSSMMHSEGADGENAGDNSLKPLKSDSSDNTSSKNRKYDTRKPPRRRGRGSKLRGPDPDTWTRQGYSRKLPNGLIIGVKKGGTRALLEFLRVHPDIRAPGPEPHFFDRNYEKGLDWYRSQMPPTLDSQLTMEKTPSYFVTKGVPARIFNMSRDIKLIVVVRDPVTRAISDYTQSSSKRTDVKAFEEMAFLDNTTGLVDTSWGAIRIGVYAKHLERWLKYFPLTQMHFVSGERLISDPAAELAKVQDFLGLKRVITDKHFYFNSTKGFPCLKKPEGSGNPHCLGKTKGRPHPKVDPKVIKRLHDFYRPFNAKFYQMTSIDFNWH